MKMCSWAFWIACVMTKDKEEKINQLAQIYYSNIFTHWVLRLESQNEHGDDEPVKLLVVNDATPSTGRMDLWIWGKTKNFPYRVVMAEVTPDEYSLIQSRRIPFPEEWKKCRIRVIGKET